MGRRKINTNVERLEAICAEIVLRNPFFGHLLMHVDLGFRKCKTAYTNARGIYFGEEFFNKLSDDEVKFVVLHEILHISHGHCFRAKDFIKELYNIAADIVVNSEILDNIFRRDFKVAGYVPMHLCPDGSEGRNYTAEEVYYMLLKKMAKDSVKNSKEFANKLKSELGMDSSSDGLDSHDEWSQMAQSDYIEEKMETLVKEAIEKARKAGWNDVTVNMIRNIDLDITDKGAVKWYDVLMDFLVEINNKYDYTFAPPDRRMTDWDIFLPDFNEADKVYSIKDVWFLIDTSSSMEDDNIKKAYKEIKGCIEQIEGMKGYLSFFDCTVTPPVPFENADELLSIIPEGGGGTSFEVIFEYMREHMSEKLPKVIIILTDGGATYPEESVALGIPVVWVIDGPRSEADFGKTIFV